VQVLSGELTARTGERDQLQARADDLVRDLAAAGQQLQAETRRAEETAARANQDRAASEKAVSQLEARLTDSTARAGELERHLTTTREQLGTTHTAQARPEAVGRGHSARRRSDRPQRTI
jgi:chromosome segregation ATPase